MKRTFAAMSPL